MPEAQKLAHLIEQFWLAGAGSCSYRMNHVFVLPESLRE